MSFPRKLSGAEGFPIKASDFLDGTYFLQWSDNMPTWDGVLTGLGSDEIANNVFDLSNLPPYNLPVSYPQAGLPLALPRCVIFLVSADYGFYSEPIADIDGIFNSLKPSLDAAGIYSGYFLGVYPNTDTLLNTLFLAIYSLAQFDPAPTLGGDLLVFHILLMNHPNNNEHSTWDVFGGMTDTTGQRQEWQDLRAIYPRMREIFLLADYATGYESTPPNGMITPLIGTPADKITDTEAALDYFINDDVFGDLGWEEGGIIDESIAASFFETIIESHFGITL